MTRDPRQPLPAGTRIASYRIDSVLGAGGAAITYAATNMVVHRRVAIKEYLPIGLAQRASDAIEVSAVPGRIQEFAKGLERFVDEARTLATFRHPSVAPIEHYIQTNGTAYVVMPYVEGETLAAVLRARGRLTHAEVDALLPPLLDALAAVHAAGLIHGDLKPGNIILKAPDKPVLIDFGSARQAGDAAHAHGSPGYAAPEAYRRRARATTAGDVYALGAVLYRALTGQAPPAAPERAKGAETASITEAALRQARLPLLDAIDRALALEPARRPGSIAAFRGLMERDPEAVLHARRTGNPRRAAWIGAAAALVLAFVLVIATTTDISQDHKLMRPPQPVAVRTLPQAAAPPARFRDCADCPLMETQADRKTAMAIEPISQRAFAAFVAATGHNTPGGCVRGDGVDGWQRDTGLDWRRAGDPVTCVNWRDAQAYAEWLSGRTGKSYRLPTAAEMTAQLAREPMMGPDLARRLNEIAPGTKGDVTAKLKTVSEWTGDCWAQGDGPGLYCGTRLVVNWRDPSGRRVRSGLPTDLRHRRVGFRVVQGPRPDDE